MKNKIIRLLYVSVDRAEFLANKFIILSEKKGLFNKIIKVFIRNKLHKQYNIIIGDTLISKSKISFPHPQNIVLGSDVSIGENCIIYQDVTIGQNRGGYPQIGNDVIIYPGAKIIGNITVGDRVIIGANSVVTTDVPSNSVVGGVPAKVIKSRCIDDEYY